MKKRRAPFETMSAAFLDVIACALGGTLLLLLISKMESAKSATVHEKKAAAARTQNEAVSEELAKVTKEFQNVKTQFEEDRAEFEEQQDRHQKTVNALGGAIEKLKGTQASLAGIKGEMRNVVFVLDLSGSMTSSFNANNELIEQPQLVKRFAEVKSKIKQLIQRLDFDQFAIIGFGGTENAQPRLLLFENDWASNTNENRANAQSEIDRWQASGGTPTLAALQRAFKYPSVDTVILYSDGEPTIPIGNTAYSQEQTEKLKAEVLRWLEKENSNGRVAVNTVPIGSYNSDTLEQFMRRIADDNGGVCAPF